DLSEDVMVFSTQEARSVNLLIRSSSEEKIQGTVRLDLPRGWKAEPSSAPFELEERGAEVRKTVKVYPSSGENSSVIKAVLTIDGKDYDRSLQIISYDHFPAQTLLPAAEAKAVRINLKKAGERIGFIRGAGDDIPAALRNMGYQVW